MNPDPRCKPADQEEMALTNAMWGILPERYGP